MRVAFEGRLIDVEDKGEKGVRGVLLQGTYAHYFYAKQGDAARSVQATMAQVGAAGEVKATGDVFPGRDYESGAPDGKLTIRVDTMAAAVAAKPRAVASA